jgi:D-glucuronyl C5-epimerase C-terminus
MSRANEANHSSPLTCAIEALRNEILAFSFADSYEVDLSGVSRGAIHYPVFSRNLTWTALRMDSAGVPQAWSRTTGTQYLPGYIAWYALVQLTEYHQTGEARHLEAFLRQLNWLERNATWRDDGAVVWEMKFDYLEDDILLRIPWVSAFAQGLAISALVRGWRVTREPMLLKLLERAARVFELNVSEGGVRTMVSGMPFYTERPGGRVPGILDGFLVSLAGLNDLAVETSDAGVQRLFSEGADTLKRLIDFWNYRNKWSWYGSRNYLCPWRYHFWNRALLKVLGAITDTPALTELARDWDATRLSPVDRAEIYLLFLLTKNRHRIRRRTWKQRSLS